MTNPYYTETGSPTSQSRGLSSQIRSEFASIRYGFDLVYAQAFSTALPGISASTAGMTVTNNGTAGAWIAVPNKPWTTVSSTPWAASAGSAYLLTNASTTTVTLPASPSANDIVVVKVANGRIDNVLDLNGNTFEGDSIGTLVLTSKYSCIYIQFLNNSWRLV